MNKPLVSIITPLYNSELYISRTIQSVLHQDYLHWELIIIDDCSVDKGLEIVRKIAEDEPRIRILTNEKNLGPALTRNKGIEEAKGKYIAFLDSDDQWHENKLLIQVQFMEESEIDFSFTYYNQINEEGRELSKIENLPSKVTYVSTMKSNKIGCLTAMYNQEKFGKLYMKNIRKRQDYTLWLQLLKKTKYAYCVPQILATYTVRKESVSSNKFSLVKYHWHIYRHIENQSFFTSLYYLSYYIISRISRK